LPCNPIVIEVAWQFFTRFQHASYFESFELKLLFVSVELTAVACCICRRPESIVKTVCVYTWANSLFLSMRRLKQSYIRDQLNYRRLLLFPFGDEHLSTVIVLAAADSSRNPLRGS
jgi:hypothetical protein